MQNEAVTYWYEGHCPQTGAWLRLPRTQAAEQIARTLMAELAQSKRFQQEGKMYGVLLAEDTDGRLQVLKAFSGLLQGTSEVAGWVPPIPGRATVALEEALTLSQLEAMKQELIALQNLPARSHLATLTQQYQQELHQLAIAHQQRKQERHYQRATLSATLSGEELAVALAQLNQTSQQDGLQRRQLKAYHQTHLQPLQQVVAAADERMQALKHQRQQLSRQLQTQLYAAYQLTNFGGQTAALSQLMPNGLLPTGTGDCCAPKLLHAAATKGWQPLAMAEFWWGAPQSGKIPGEFYGACRDRCQPLMGFLLGGIGPAQPQAAGSRQQAAGEPLTILFEDEWLVAVVKPAGLLSVPGRTLERQDSVQSRLQSLDPELRVVHRLDQDTSGILLLARDVTTEQVLRRQFAQRQVHKHYEALLAGVVTVSAGVIELPLRGDPNDRPRQRVDWQQGKASTTKFRVLAVAQELTRMEFVPLTGRTHQLRVHAADPQGLGVPIWGDRLYRDSPSPITMTSSQDELDTGLSLRLHLHAKTLICQHPHTRRSLHLNSDVPF